MNDCSTPTALCFVFIDFDCIDFVTNLELVKPVSDAIPQTVQLLDIERLCYFVIDSEVRLPTVEDIRHHIRECWSGCLKRRNEQLN